MKAKIFIAYHKKAKLIKNNILEPIHVGRAINTSEWLEQNMFGDNLGENISDKNGRYCELTSQYYVWKNTEEFKDLDYIGFCHYRRFFNFNTNVKYKENLLSQVEYPFLDDNYSKLFGLDEKNIIDTLSGYDLITFAPFDLTKENHKNVYQQYKIAHDIKSYNKTLEILLKKYPEYKEAVKTYNKSKYGYFANSFVMKKELFNNYAEWLFSILFEAEKQITNKSENDRLMGYISERLFGIFVTHLKLKNYKIRELQQVFIVSSDKKNNIPVVFACNNNYVLHLCCAISSILEHASEDDFYFFYIINSKKNLNYLSKKLISRIKSDNCRIIFSTIDESIFNNMPLTSCCKHISKETYYRFILPELFPMLSKILYLDCDITVKAPLFDLFNTDIRNFYMGGVIDLLSKESEERLKLEKYCNAGVLLINLDKWREDGIQEQLFSYVENNIEKIVWQDQDALNVVLQDAILYIDKIWNAQVGEYEPCFTRGYNQVGQNAKIIHHIGCSKPWMKDCKSPFKQEYFNALNNLGWEYKYLKYYSIKCEEFLIELSKKIKEVRKKLIWYDKTNKQLIFFNKYKFKLNDGKIVV